MRWIIATLLCLHIVVGFAQKNYEGGWIDYKGVCSFSYPSVKLNGNSVAIVADYLRSNIENMSDSRCQLMLVYYKESPGGFHYSFVQTYLGVEVYQSEMKVNLDRNNTIRSVFDNSFYTRHWNADVAASVSPFSVILLHPETGVPILAERRIENGVELLIVGGKVVFSRDTRSYFAAPDSLVSGKIFNPDPLTTSQQLYTVGMFDDNGDANSTWLNNQLVTVTFPANFTGSEFRLENNYIKIADVDSPKVLPAVSSTPQFYFNRSQTGFEDVNAFYHLNKYREHVQQLGFNLANSLVIVDAHAWSGSDQSSFTPNGGNPELDFGIGGVDDAEDADVLIHEYAHFLSYNAAPGSNIGSQRNSLDEAFGDYTAASYSAALSNFNKDWVFNWDGPVWSGNNSGGRTVATSKVYPTDLTGSVYQNAPIWSTALMSIHNEIGRAATDSLIFQTHYSYASNISMGNAAQLLIDADTLLNNGAYYCAIYKHLLARGLVAFYPANPCGISSIGNEPLVNVSFRHYASGFTVSSTESQQLQFRLYNLSGALIDGAEINHFPFHYSNFNLPNSLYIVELKSSAVSQTFKWVKAE